MEFIDFLKLLKEGKDEEACRLLVQACFQEPALMALAKIIRPENPKSLILEIIADFWLHIKRKMSELKADDKPLEIKKLLGYIYTMLKNKMGKNRHYEELNFDLSIDEIEEEIDSLKMKAIRKGIPELSEVNQEILHLFYTEGFSLEAVGEHLDCSKDSAKARLWKARKQLKTICASILKGTAEILLLLVVFFLF